MTARPLVAPLLWRLTCALCLALWLAPSHALMRLGEITMVRDPSGQMTLDEVERAPAEAFRGLYLRFFDRSTVWLRLPIAPVEQTARSATQIDRSESSAENTLRVVGMFMAQAHLYDPLQKGPHAGQPVPIDVNPLAMHQTFSLPIRSGAEPRALWLRVQPDGPLFASASLVSNREFLITEARTLIFDGLLLGLLGAFFLLSVSALTLERSALMAAWVAKQSTNLGVSLLNLQWHTSEQWMHATLLAPHPGLELIRYLNPIFSLWFFMAVHRQFSSAAWVTRMSQVLAVLMLINLFISVFVDMPFARALNIILFWAGIGVVALLGMSISTGQSNHEASTPYAYIWTSTRTIGAGLLFGSAWLCSFPVGLYNVIALGPTLLVLFSGFTSAALILMLVWRQRNETIERQAQERVRSEIAAQALELERNERVRQQEFMVMLTHELKAPLSTIGMVLQSAGASGSMRHHADLALGTMRRVIDHCAKSIRLEDADPALANQHCSLAVQWQLRLDALQATERDRFKLDFEPMLPDIRADLDALTVVLSNLVDNALKYSPKGSPIQVGLRSHLEGASRFQTLCVMNQPRPGPLPQADLLFGKYYRGENQLPVGGSGLGLYLSRAMTRRMHGELSCDIQAQQIRFTLQMPQ